MLLITGVYKTRILTNLSCTHGSRYRIQNAGRGWGGLEP